MDCPTGGNGTWVVSSGGVIDGLEIGIYDKNHVKQKERYVGEIGIRGDFLFDGYFGLEELTRERIVDSVYFTRDIGFIDNGQLFVLGRVDDMIIIQGRNIYSHQIEELLSSIDGIKPGRSCAFGMFDDRSGSEALYIICEEEVQGTGKSKIEEIKRNVRELVFSHLLIAPKEIQIVPQKWLMKTSSGKIGRKENKAKFLREKHGGTK